MGCGAVEKLLNDFAVGSLSLSQETRLRRHSDECAECAEHVEAIEAVRERLARLNHDIKAQPTPFVFSPFVTTGAERQAGQRGSWWLRGGQVLLAAAALIGLAVIVYPETRPMRDMSDVAPDASHPVTQRDHLPGRRAPRISLVSRSDRRLAPPARYGTPKVWPYRSKPRKGRAESRGRVPSLVIPKRRNEYHAEPKDFRGRRDGIPLGRRGDTGKRRTT